MCVCKCVCMLVVLLRDLPQGGVVEHRVLAQPECVWVRACVCVDVCVYVGGCMCMCVCVHTCLSCFLMIFQLLDERCVAEH